MPAETASAPVLRAHDVHKSYGRRSVLRGADLAVAPGELAAVVGENGAGKSTLLKIPAGTLSLDRGAVALSGALGHRPQDPVLNQRISPLHARLPPPHPVASTIRWARPTADPYTEGVWRGSGRIRRRPGSPGRARMGAYW